MRMGIEYIVQATSYYYDGYEGVDTRYYSYASLYNALLQVLLYSGSKDTHKIVLYAKDEFRYRYIVDNNLYYINNPIFKGECIVQGKIIRAGMKIDYIEGSKLLLVPISEGKDCTINIESTDGVVEIGYYHHNHTNQFNQSVFGTELLDADLIEEYDTQINNKFRRADNSNTVILLDGSGEVNKITVGDII